MNKTLFTLLMAVSFWSGASAQQYGVTHSGQSTLQEPFPLECYTELKNPKTADPSKWAAVSDCTYGWGSTNVRYKNEEPYKLGRTDRTIRLKGWRGERIAAQWVLSTKTKISDLRVEVTDLKHVKGHSCITKDHIFRGFVRYVMTDELNKDGKGGCGYRPDASLYDSTLVADPIDHLSAGLAVEPNSTRAGWIRLSIPQQAATGLYEADVRLYDAAKQIGHLKLVVEVINRTLPQPSDWTFHLDLWQNPFAIARYHGVELWTKEHFETMRPYMELYRDAGGKVITTSIMHKPWNGQTYDYFETMVTWIKKADGTWAFDYTVFDRWVEFMMDLGIRDEIVCYSMVPWRLSFRYFDQASNSMKEIETKPGEQAYDQMWGAMLQSFAQHLRRKGWFELTHISMDERPEEVMKTTLKIIRHADPEFKVSLAGALHEDLLYEIDDYCVALRMKYPDEAIDKRRAVGKTTTFYTSCEEARPNTFTFCPPAEAAWFGWYAAKARLDGYLRWALNSWVIEPLLDSRFYTWAAGDTYLIYPCARTSIRFEKMIEGIQAYEKVRILKAEYQHTNNHAALKRLERILSLFDETQLLEHPAEEVIEKANQFVNM